MHTPPTFNRCVRDELRLAGIPVVVAVSRRYYSSIDSAHLALWMFIGHGISKCERIQRTALSAALLSLMHFALWYVVKFNDSSGKLSEYGATRPQNKRSPFMLCSCTFTRSTTK